MEKIKCIKCLAKSLEIPNAYFLEVDDNYICQSCGEQINVTLMNNIIRDKLTKRVKRLRNNPESYIKNIVKLETDSSIDVGLLEQEKNKIQAQIRETFEKYMSLEIYETDYKNRIKEFSNRLNIIDEEIIKAENLPLQNKIRDEISNFLIAVNLNTIDIVHDILYDIRSSKIEIIFKFEHELNFKAVSYSSIIEHEGYTPKDFKIDDILLDYVRCYPSLKLEEYKKLINEKYHNLYTYNMIKKSMQRLEKRKLVMIDGTHRMYDGYKLVDDDPLNKRDKITLNLIKDNPDLSMVELGKILNIYPSAVRERVKRLKRLGYIENDKYTREPYKKITKDEKLTIVNYVINNPKATTRFLSSHFERDRSMIREILKNANLVYEKGERLWKQM